MTNQLIIFSKNRACQLHLLLESLNKNAIHLFDKITILYKADFEYVLGYKKLISIFGDTFNFHQEQNFRDDLLNLIDDNITFTTFLVDDVVIYDKIEEPKGLLLNMFNNEVCCFSLRLGLNCEYSHPANLSYTIKGYSEIDNIIAFSHKNQIGDFSYPLSTDGHIFNTNMLKNILKTVYWNSPNSLEANIQVYVNKVPSLILSFKKSKLVSIPNNMVNNDFRNRHGLLHYMSEKELNNKYLNGEIIDLENMDFTNINGPHKEIKYEFKRS